MYFLDTNTCIDFLRGKNTLIYEHFNLIPNEEMQIPAIVKAELLTGAVKSKIPATLERTEKLLANFETVPFIDGMTYTYAKIRAQLEVNGTPIGSNDMLIAATALYFGATLVTHNTGEFSRIKELSLEDWNM